MMEKLKRNWIFAAAAFAIAAAVHLASVHAIPDLVMMRVLSVAAQRTGFNTMVHTARATARSRFVVRPSPDLFYSSCAYDLSTTPNHALRVHASAMPDTYWSVSAFDARTNNFFVMNDRQARSGSVDIVIIAPGAYVGAAKVPVIVSPTLRGLVLFRTLINSETRLAEIDAGRRRAACEPFAAD